LIEREEELIERERELTVERVREGKRVDRERKRVDVAAVRGEEREDHRRPPPRQVQLGRLL